MYNKSTENNYSSQPFSTFDRMEDNALTPSSNTEKFKNFLYRKRIYFLFGFGIVILAIIIITISSTGDKDNIINNEKERPSEIERKEPEIIEPFSKYYSLKTKNYLNFLSSLEEKKYIAYHYTFQNNSKGSFSNKYQYLYENDTSLIPNNSEVGKYLFQEESYLTVETDEVNYYKNILKKTPPKHYIYGPSSIEKEYNEGQKLYNPNLKLNDTKDWEGMSISLNIKQYPNMGNNNAGHIFGWGVSDWQAPGFYISVVYGAIHFKDGKYVSKYSNEDSIKLGYNQTKPETKYLTYRPLTDKRWHQLIVSTRKVTKEDVAYLDELSLKEGDYKCELFIDGTSRKNTSAYIRDDYGNFSAFDFNDDLNQNPNFYIDNIIVLKKGININEAKILFESIDQEAEIIIPNMPNKRCKIPGDKYGLKPDEIYPDSIYPLKAEIRFFQFTSKWSCLGFSYEQFIKERLNEFCSEHLNITDLQYLYNKLQYFQLENNYRYDIFDVLKYYLPQINEKFKNLETFKKYVKISSTNENGKDLKNHVISNIGYWISSEGLLQVNRTINGTIRLPVANINYFAYFQIENGFKNGRIYTISVENSDDIKFAYNEKKIIT